MNADLVEFRQVKLGELSTDQVRFNQIKLGDLSTDQVKLGDLSTDQVKFIQVLQVYENLLGLMSLET